MLHDIAAKGFQAASESYERGRPDYPLDSVAQIVRQLELGAGRIVADVGAGTGKFTRMLLSSGAKVIAVEPVEAMRRKFSEILPDIELKAGSAEAMPFEAGSIDAVVVAQAFHWFDIPKALGEFHRVLKPGGRLGLVWNIRETDSDLTIQMNQIIDAHEGNAPRYRSGEWKRALSLSHLFSPAQAARFTHTQKGPVEMVVDRVLSISFIAALSEAERETIRHEVLDLLSSHPATQKAAKEQGEIELPYHTDVYWCSRRG